MSANTTTAGLPIRTTRSSVLYELATSPVVWFPEYREADEGTETADVWTDHHRVVHERHPTHDGMTWCLRRILGSDAPSHSRIFAVACRACVAARDHAT